jgi:hypothetical protein
LSAPSNNKHSVVGTALASVGHLIYLLIKALPRYAFGAWVALVLAVAIGFWKIESVTEANHKLAVQAQHLSKPQQCNHLPSTPKKSQAPGG